MSGEVVHESALRTESVTMMTDAVAKDPDAIGYLPLPSLTNTEGIVKPLTIEDVEMSKCTIMSGRYPFTRSFYYVIYHKPTNAAKAFLQFAFSDEGQKIIEEYLSN